MTALQLDKRPNWFVKNWSTLLGFGIPAVLLAAYIGDDIIDGGMTFFLKRVFNGLDNGVLYAVVAVALVLIFKATTLVNFAQGELAMFGSFLAYVGAVTLGLNDFRVGFLPVGLIAAIVVAMAISAAAGAAVERVLIRPFDPTDHLPVVLITLGLFLVLNSIAAFIWNKQARAFPSLFPPRTENVVVDAAGNRVANASIDADGNIVSSVEGLSLEGLDTKLLPNAIEIGGAQLFYEVIGNMAVLAGMCLALYLILQRTKIGLAFRAVSSNTESSRLVGVRVGRVLGFGWALASAFGTLGGVLVAPKLNLKPDMMVLLLIFSFAAATVGGLDSLIGAVVGGLSIGLIESLLVEYLSDNDTAFSVLKLAVAFVVILAVLWVKPSGLFGTSSVERV